MYITFRDSANSWLLSHNPADSEDGQKQRQGNPTNDKAHDNDHKGLDIACEFDDLLFEFLLAETSDLFHNEREFSPFFATVKHLGN